MNSQLFPAFSVGNLKIEPALVLAPMSGITHRAFRRLIRMLNPGALGLCVSEFISVEGLTRNSRRSLEMLRFSESERPVGIQIFGYDPARMRDAALMVQDCGVDLLDINCGCPAPKVVKNGGGCELMRQPDHLVKIFRAVRTAVKIPLTMKMRSGWDENSRNALEVARIAELEGIEAVTVHGRTRTQLYRGLADWEIVAQVAQSVKIPVLGSGDVVDFNSARSALSSGVKGLFIGRAALSRPWVFSEIVAGHHQIAPNKPAAARLVGILNMYIKLLREDFKPEHCVGRIKQLASQMCRGFDWGTKLCRVNSLQEQLAILQQIQLEAAVNSFDVKEPAQNVAC